ncbi:HopJ type III effector protein [Mucilaginibacter sp. PAMC 26640]|nr:HopJ type III effector protein [Mucilaginibacter sp. PAMC 26640]
MNQELNTLLTGLKTNTVAFKKVLEFIDTYFLHQPTAFKNGNLYNEASQNQGSARVFAIAKINNLTVDDTLLLFAEHYQAVLADPVGTDHQNIRQFMSHGWAGIEFEGVSLIAKS